MHDKSSIVTCTWQVFSLIKQSCDITRMPYWSIGEWRARIGSSWCALGRPIKIIKHGARIVNKELTWKRIATMLILLMILVAVNVGVRGLIEGRQLICKGLVLLGSPSVYFHGQVISLFV